jgi:hypothetical protein
MPSPCQAEVKPKGRRWREETQSTLPITTVFGVWARRCGNGWILVQRPGQAERPLPLGDPIITEYDAMGGSLLILGAPGAGKTTTGCSPW